MPGVARGADGIKGLSIDGDECCSTALPWTNCRNKAAFFAVEVARRLNAKTSCFASTGSRSPTLSTDERSSERATKDGYQLIDTGPPMMVAIQCEADR